MKFSLDGAFRWLFPAQVRAADAEGRVLEQGEVGRRREQDVVVEGHERVVAAAPRDGHGREDLPEVVEVRRPPPVPNSNLQLDFSVSIRDTFDASFFGRASRTRREQSIRPKISRIDFDVTELENSQVWSGPPKPVVEFGTGHDLRRPPPEPRALRDDDRAGRVRRRRRPGERRPPRRARRRGRPRARRRGRRRRVRGRAGKE